MSNTEEKFKNDIKIMSRIYFNASDRLKTELFIIDILIKIVIVFTLGITIILFDNYNKILSSILIINSLFITIFINNTEHLIRKSIKFLNSGNKLKDILRSIENKKISIEDAKERYSIIIDLNDNREEIDRKITYEENNHIREKLYRTLFFKIICKYTVPYITIIITVILLFYFLK